MKAGPSIWTVVTLAVCGLWAGRPAFCADIAIDHIEFVQVVQDHDNHVPLVAGKSTLARVFLTSSGNDGQDVTSGISGTMVADSLPDTLRPFGLPAIAPAGAPDQNNQQHSLNFLLPRSWTIQTTPLTVRATATLNGGPARTQAASATFQIPAGWPSVFRVARVDVCALDVNGVRQCPPSLGDVSDVMQKTFPLADGAVEYNPVAASVIDWPGALSFAPDEQTRLSKFLTAYYFLLEQPVHQLFAWLPAIDGVTGMEALATGRGRAWWDPASCPAAPCGDAAAQLARGVAFNLGGDTFQSLFDAKVASPAAPPAEYLIIGGTVAADGGAQLDPGYRVTSAYAGAPSDPNGPYCLRFFGGAAADYCFSAFLGSGGFVVKAPFPQGTTRVALMAGDTELTALTVSDTAPLVAFVSPGAGDAWQGKRIIQWTGSDPGGASLVYALQYSADNGVSWTALTLNLSDTQYEVDGTRISGGSQVLFRVLASNGLNTASTVVGPVTVQQSPKLTLGPTPLNFLNVTLGQSVDRTLLLNSSGSGPLTASGQIPGGSYRFVSGSGSLLIPPGEQRAITVRWTPTNTGTQQATLALTSGDPSLHSVNVTMSGVAFDNPVPSIAISAASLDFGSVNSGQTKDVKVTLSNGGTAELTVRSISASSARYSVVMPALPVTIAAGESVDVMVRFSPTGVGSVASTLSIFSNDPTRSSVTVALTGSGSVPAPAISVAPSSIDFGPVTVGQTKDLKFTIGNTGTADLTVRSISSGAAAYTVVSPAAPFTVASGSSTDVTVRFAPVASGQASSSLILSTNDPVRLSVTVTLAGSSSISAQPSIAIAPGSLDFGGVPIGLTRDSKFTVSNVGGADLIVSAINGDAGVFSIVSPAPPFTVASGRSVDVTVRFAPTATVAASASLAVASNDPAKATLPVSVTGAGLGAAATTVLRTIAYHEITALTVPMNIYNLPLISRNGNRAIFSARPTDPKTDPNMTDLSVINTDGTGLKKIDTSIYNNPHFLGVSDDGSRALVWGPQFLRTVNVDTGAGTTILAVSNDSPIQGARISGDGRTVVFVNGHDSTLSYGGGSRLAASGIWAINSDGSSLRQIASAADVSALLDRTSVFFTIDSNYPSGMDLSVSGGRIAFGVNTPAKGRVLMAVNGDGSVLHVLRAGLFRLYSCAISGDGSTVGYSAALQLNGAPEFDSIRFDGSGAITIGQGLSAGSMQLNNDGSLLFAGGEGSGLLARTDGSSFVYLFAPVWGAATQLAIENFDFNRATMNGAGTRFLFTAPDFQTGFFQLATADINPTALGAAPAIASPAVSPASIPGDGAGYNVSVSGKVTSATPITVGSAQSFLNGLHDVPGTVLTDLGGGSWTGSLFFANAPTGPRVIRMKEETVGVDGKRHATAIDIGGFSVK